MANTLNITLLIIAFILLFFNGIMLVRASQDVKLNEGADPNLTSAYTYLVWASVISFIGLFILFVAIISAFFLKKKIEDKITFSGFLFVLLFTSLILMGIVGVLASLGASKISCSGVVAASSAYHNALVSAVLSIMGVFLLLGLIIYDVAHHSKDAPAVVVKQVPAQVVVEKQKIE